MRGRVDILNKYVGIVSKAVGKAMKANKGTPEEALAAEYLKRAEDSTGLFLDEILGKKETLDQNLAKLSGEQLKKFSKEISSIIEVVEVQMTKLEKERDSIVCAIGNIVHESVVISDNEDNNGIVKTFVGAAKEKMAEKQKDLKLLGHVDLMKKMAGINTEQGSVVAGNRAYFLTGDLVKMNLALINFGIDYLSKRGYCPIQTPYFMLKDIMAEVAQLEQFDDELYKVSGEGDDKYLIATSEQPICAFHRDQWFDDKQLPLRYVGYSACFRKEVGSHGKDTLGIFRVHQFEKIEQFCVTTPKDTKSWEMMDEMIKNSEDFYQAVWCRNVFLTFIVGSHLSCCQHC